MVVNKVSNGYRWLMLTIMGMGTMVAGQMLWLFYGYYDLIQAYFGVTNTQMDYIGTMTGLIMIINWPVGGMIADRLSMRASYTICIIWSFVVYSFFAFNKSFAMYMIVMALSNVVVGMFYGLFAKVVKGVSTEKEGYSDVPHPEHCVLCADQNPRPLYCKAQTGRSGSVRKQYIRMLPGTGQLGLTMPGGIFLPAGWEKRRGNRATWMQRAHRMN